jgi:hypothetical protein
MKLHAVVYDTEIVRKIPDSGEERIPGIEYCNGWTDFVGMGIAVLCAIDLWTDRAHVFLEDNLDDFAKLVAARGNLVIGYNSKRFDDKLLAAHEIRVETAYDLGEEILSAIKSRRKLVKGGQTLSEIARVNLNAQKALDGAQAPVLWQQGKRGQVINYCMKDTWLLAQLVRMGTKLKDPVTGQLFEVAPIPVLEPELALA